VIRQLAIVAPLGLVFALPPAARAADDKSCQGTCAYVLAGLHKKMLEPLPVQACKKDYLPLPKAKKGKKSTKADCQLAQVSRRPRLMAQVCTSGPEGSGRYWQISVRIGPPGKAPTVCADFPATTIGWRRFGNFPKGIPNWVPLSWLQDLDRNGRHELVIWDSLPMHEEASNASYALMARVYDIDSEGFVPAPKKSIPLFRALARSYRDQADRQDRSETRKRSLLQVARGIEAFTKKPTPKELGVGKSK
jgi:hypothetical protein